MKSPALPLPVAALFAAFTLASNLHAQPLVNIETVTVGDAGNAADTAYMNDSNSTTGYGSVGYEFNIGKYEVTIGQYATFLNSVAAVTSDSYIVSLWNLQMTPPGTFVINGAGISRSGGGTLASPYSYTVIGSGNRPITYVSWFDAARFANWMNNGATNGASTETGAYTLNGATTGIITKNANATWFIPSEDQWYKAAYYKGGGTDAGYWLYPTESDTSPGTVIYSTPGSGSGDPNMANYGMERSDPAYTPAINYLTEVGAFSNSASAYDTFDQGGNVWEWNDAVIGSSRGLRGGSWFNSGFFDSSGFGGDGDLQSSARLDFFDPTGESVGVGFRVASVPEPSTAVLVLIGAGALYFWKRRRVTL